MKQKIDIVRYSIRVDRFKALIVEDLPEASGTFQTLLNVGLFVPSYSSLPMYVKVIRER